MDRVIDISPFEHGTFIAGIMVNRCEGIVTQIRNSPFGSCKFLGFITLPHKDEMHTRIVVVSYAHNRAPDIVVKVHLVEIYVEGHGRVGRTPYHLVPSVKLDEIVMADNLRHPWSAGTDFIELCTVCALKFHQVDLE